MRLLFDWAAALSRISDPLMCSFTGGCGMDWV